MIKIQVQIPDKLFPKAKELAARKEWSFAEIVRRGLEYMIETNRAATKAGAKWQQPAAYNLGKPRVTEDWWTELSH